MAGPQVTGPAGLLAEAGAGAPPVLLARAAEFVAAGRVQADPADSLARAAEAALDAALQQGGDRAGALDLLAADLLVTLALATRADRAPGRLAEFAAGLRAGGSAPRVERP